MLRAFSHVRSLVILVSCLFLCCVTAAQASEEEACSAGTLAGRGQTCSSTGISTFLATDLSSDAHLRKQAFKRQQASYPQLKNNGPASNSIAPGDLQRWLFPASELGSSLSTVKPIIPGYTDNSTSSTQGKSAHLELKRQGQRGLYITLSVCAQPNPSSNPPASPPPGLTLYVSYSSSSTDPPPGPNKPGFNSQAVIGTIGGYAEYPDQQKSGDTYIAVSAPETPGFSGNYSYQIAVSIDQVYASYNDYQSLSWVDSDSTAGFLATANLTRQGQIGDQDQRTIISAPSTALVDSWLAASPPFSVFAHPANDVLLQGVWRSFCGLQRFAQVQANVYTKSSQHSEVGMNNYTFNTQQQQYKYTNTTPYQQFYLGNLTNSTTYTAILGLASNYTTQANQTIQGGGGTVWRAINFTTRAEENCQLLYNLTFCSSVAYSVPTNSDLLKNFTQLQANYDSFSAALWTNFSNSLEQIPCYTSPDAQYSLARNCSDCSTAYKNWLCAVTIPRCADFSADPAKVGWLKIRNANQVSQSDIAALPQNSSLWNDLQNPLNANARNTNQSSDVGPGPYKEVLPCINLCYDLIQSCPASLGFACPYAGRGQEWAYGTIGNGTSVDGYPPCNVPGRVWGVSAAEVGLRPSWALLLGMTIVWAIRVAVP